jgi:hypothetical protein
MAQIVNVVVWENGGISRIPVNIEKLPEDLREKYEPFVGKTVHWEGNQIVEESV